MAHRSWCAETIGQDSNERLEFLGDAVLQLVVTDHIFRTYDRLPEGELAKVRASVVNSSALAEVASDLQIGQALLLGKGEDQSGGREKPSILADAMEALIGAAYIDGGWAAAAELVMNL
ncbi:MAG TPA: ribonuclease III domain-containing protein, partial [Acidimicrobiales bacterium]|nr:ribonuclease III domain-containing protein [Acidimicrobiales bacterium]